MHRTRLPWTEEKLRQSPPFEFENWAAIALGGIPNKAQVGDMGIDGRIFPVAAGPARPRGASASGRSVAAGETPTLPFMDVWYPIQVKQKDRVGRPDIDSFEAVMTRADRNKGLFVAFDYSDDGGWHGRGGGWHGRYATVLEQCSAVRASPPAARKQWHTGSCAGVLRRGFAREPMCCAVRPRVVRCGSTGLRQSRAGSRGRPPAPTTFVRSPGEWESGAVGQLPGTEVPGNARAPYGRV